MQVSIGVVKAFGTSCPVPDPGQVLFAPFESTLSYDLSDSTAVKEFAIPVPSNWKLLGSAFLSVGFPAVTDSCATDADQPRIAMIDGCSPCVTYEYFAGTVDDVCPTAAAMPLISVDVAECLLTPALPRSWGAVKTLYR